MKKLLLSLMLAAISLTGMSQTVGDAFYVYRNDGEFNLFYCDEVDSMAYSYEYLDGSVASEVVTQLIYTADSTYRIPLGSIDSISCVQPATKYLPDVCQLEGNLLNYVVSVDGMTLTLKPETPKALLPSVGDKIATVEFSDIFPFGFLGRALSVDKTDNAIVVKCEPIDLTDVVSSFSMTADIVSVDEEETSAKSAAWESKPRVFNINIGEKTASFELSGFIKTKDLLKYKGKAKVNISFNPKIEVRATYMVDPFRGLYAKFHIVADTKASVGMEIAGEASREWKKKIKIPDVPLPFGFTFYIEPGAKLEACGELAVGMTYATSGRQVMDITYCPLVPVFNRVEGHPIPGASSFNLDYAAARATLKGGLCLELGLGYVNHNIAKVGGEFELGVKGTYESVLDMNLLRDAANSTAFYQAAQKQDKIDVRAYCGAKFVAALLSSDKDKGLKFSVGRSWDIPGTNLFTGRNLPVFSNTKLKADGASSATATASISGVLPYARTVGLALFDEDGNRVATYTRPAMYENHVSSSTSLGATFNGLDTSKKYKVYPVTDMFGYEVLATPEATMEQTSCPDSNHPHAIDLGLPSGTKWACCNVGASAPEGYGGYYAWGETEEKSVYDFTSYKYYTGTNETSGTWISLGSDIAGTGYDVAHVKWGGRWHMPTLDQCKELINNTSSKWTTKNGINGREFTGPNGGTIFMPAAGYRWHSDLSYRGDNGDYWSSTQFPDSAYGAYALRFDSYGASWLSYYYYGYWYRDHCGQSVRPVTE